MGLGNESRPATPSDPARGLWAAFTRWLRGLLSPEVEGGASEAVQPTESASSIGPAHLEAAQEKVTEGDRVLRDREAALFAQYHENLRHPVALQVVRFENMNFFADSEWRLRPGFNLLLGRNGYGKSLLLRSTAALLKRHEKLSADLVGAVGGEKGRLHVHIRRLNSSSEEVIVRSSKQFESSIGEVPILAIPDARFTDRSVTALQAPVDETDLLRDGARQFLEQTPYQGLINEVLYELCLDYQDAKTFDLPVFEFLAGIITRLTRESFAFHSIERPEGKRLEFEIRVRTQNSTEPLPIQFASQGTLSILAVFGLIRSFLKRLALSRSNSRPLSEQEILATAAIVFIDEIDAHLHPLWQQQVRMLLTDSFPNVQFVVSAHSPLLVAGCWLGEVSVLRPHEDGGFAPVLLNRDFIGATSAELYGAVFEIEEMDPTFLRYQTKLTNRNDRDQHDNDITSLLEKREAGKLDDRQAAELERLVARRTNDTRVVQAW
ncbi:MAG: AAA family ATPase [Acidimicrobiales bacterium]